MKKEFNITGTCIPEMHYMVDISDNISEVMLLVEKGKYFTINRPRQYGKTTILELIENHLNKINAYIGIKISFEGLGIESYQNSQIFIEKLLNLIFKQFKYLKLHPYENLFETKSTIIDFEKLSDFITDLTLVTNKKMILLIDEVDKSMYNQLFLDFLGMLREKYLSRTKSSTFHSVILAGVHDVKTLKLKLRPDAEQKFNSPWNIATDFKVDMSFNPAEISTMLKDYVKDTKIQMDIEEISERLHYYTSGYPFLVSILCKIMDEEILPEKKKLNLTLQDIDSAVDTLLKSSNTNFDTLIKNLENYPNLNHIVFQMIIEGVNYTFNTDNPDINMGITHGIFQKHNGSLSIHNRIYEQRIYNYLSSKMETSIAIDTSNFRDSFISNKKLNFKKILLKFQAFMKEQYSKKDAAFLERNGRLIFLAYLKPIINGLGFDFKEVQISEERRLDVVVTFQNKKYVVELKIWRGDAAHRKGLKQLASYLEKQDIKSGFLLIFDFTAKKEWKQAKVITENKEIFMVWV